MMSSVSSLAAIQARREIAGKLGAEADLGDSYFDEHGVWLRQDNGHWQLIAPALTSLALV
jgi:hypothetical protein